MFDFLTRIAEAKARPAVRDLTADSITETVLAQMSATPDPRLKQIMESLVHHLHGFARDVSLTPDEWLKAIGFLTRVGQTCTPARQEFILLSDVIGLSALVNLLHDQTAIELGTESSLLGPFYQQDAPALVVGESIDATGEGPPLLVYGQVTDKIGVPVPHASVQVWQTDADGEYDLQKSDGAPMNMRGNFRCDAGGHFHFRTVMPLGYGIPMDGPVGQLILAQCRHGRRPAHIHFLIGAEGFRELVTAIYIANDPHIDSDEVFGVSNALVVTPRERDPDAPIHGMPVIAYDFRLAVASGDDTGRVGADPSQLLR
jgi:protocatechuate 3,4-dioxygenase beta subunit